MPSPGFTLSGRLRQVIALFVWLFRLMWPHAPTALVGRLCLCVGLALLPLIENWYLGRIIDSLVVRSPTVWSSLIGYGTATITTAILVATNSYLYQLLWVRIASVIKVLELQDRARLDLAAHHMPEVQSLLRRVADQGVHRPANMTLSGFDCIRYLLGIIFAATALAIFDGWIILLAVAASLPSLFIEWKFGERGWGIFSLQSEHQKRYWELALKFTDLSGIQALKLGEHTPYFIRELQKINSTADQQTLTVEGSRSRWEIAAGTVAQVLILAVIAFLISQVLAGLLEVGKFSFYLQTAFTLRVSLSSFFGELSRVATNALYVQDRLNLSQLRPLLDWGKHTTADEAESSIEFCSVSLRYPGGQRDALRNVSLIIQPGERIAIVGENGAGKSTFIKAMLRLYDPYNGSIRIGGTPINELSERAHNKLFSVLPQDYNLFCLPLWESVAVCQRSDLDEARFSEALEVSGLRPVVEKLEGGIEQMLGAYQSKGVELSGGEWQRVAVARALYREAPILILDEPTSAADAGAEQLFFDRLFSLRRKQTVILISHRFSTVRKADRILVMQNGELIESGSHEELLAQQGHYADLFLKQRAGYI
jgi:ABC-type multidrug transport system fused ATPase/permease subunit